MASSTTLWQTPIISTGFLSTRASQLAVRSSSPCPTASPAITVVVAVGLDYAAGVDLEAVKLASRQRRLGKPKDRIRPVRLEADVVTFSQNAGQRQIDD